METKAKKLYEEEINPDSGLKDVFDFLKKSGENWIRNKANRAFENIKYGKYGQKIAEKLGFLAYDCLDAKRYISAAGSPGLDIGYASANELKKEDALGYNRPGIFEKDVIRYVKPEDVPELLGDIYERAYQVARKTYKKLTGEKLGKKEFNCGISESVKYHELIELGKRKENRWYDELTEGQEGYVQMLAFAVMKDENPAAYSAAVGFHKVRNDWFQKATEKITQRYETLKNYLQEVVSPLPVLLDG